MKLADCNTPEPSPRRKGSRFIVRPDVRWRQVAILDKLMFLARFYTAPRYTLMSEECQSGEVESW